MISYLKYNIFRWNAYNRFWVNICIGILLLLSFTVLIIPSPYIVESPGMTVDVLGKSNDCEYISQNATPEPSTDPNQQVESVKFSYSDEKGGQILLLTVSVSGGAVSYANIYSVIGSLVNNTNDILPSEAFYPPTTSHDEIKEKNEADMQNSQNSAVTAANLALERLGKPPTNSAVSVCGSNIGGPSAGLAFTLGIIQKYGGVALTNGNIIAATGTIDNEGKVGKIGGVKEKAVSAYANGARILLAPTENVAELKLTDQPADLQIIPVDTIFDAVDALNVRKTTE